MFNTKTTIPISEARRRIFDIADEVQAPNKVYTLTADGKPKVVIMSAEEYESWMETMEVLREFPDLDKEIAETDEAVRTGAYKKWATLEDMIAKRPLAVAEKSKKRYGIRTKNKIKSRKKS
jgi:prevent-host-death family protein